MPSKTTIKEIASLRLKKTRDELGLFMVEGEKMVAEALSGDWEVVHFIAVAPMEILGRKADVVSHSDMERMSALASTSPCLATVRIKERVLSESILTSNWLFLDSISDPGNMGTIVRTADWFGLQGVYCAGDCVELYNPKVVQSSMGSVFRMNVVYGTYETFFELAQRSSSRLIGASINGKTLADFSFRPNDVIVIGNESRGISEKMQGLLDIEISIPGKGGAESLNASIAAGIMMSRL
ncbi:MAG: RNA methyltransferase [Flavobacteriales bacterium]|nr:RNA methyltransferase [Flavobacteriales bacterium]